MLERTAMPDNLALRMRPKTIDQVIGQEHLVGPGKIIRRMVEANRLSSMILYGPPGIGKTSIASAIAGTTKYAFRTFNATVDSKKRLQEIAEEAKFSGGLVLLLDEIHRLDKTKQDFLLPLLESGLVIMIGATTENPFFSVTPAIRSRVQIFELEPLSNQDVKEAIQIALTDPERGFDFPVELDADALDFIATSTNGDPALPSTHWIWQFFLLRQMMKASAISRWISWKIVSREATLLWTRMEMDITTFSLLCRNPFEVQMSMPVFTMLLA